MKALYRKIAQIMKDRVVRRRLTRCISVIAAVVVFFTTYATILPAITLEKEASCGIEEHQHNDECYEDKLICGQEESEGHQHDESCYTVTKELVCQEKEHQHSEENGCYDEEGNLICELTEHVHDDSCYEEVETLTCGQEESEGHHHTDACYEKVLVCGKEAHTHSAACYESAEDHSEDSSDETVPENDDEGNSTEVQPEKYEPELDPIDMEAMFGKYTGFYYYHPEEGEELPESSTEITDWQEVKEDTVLASQDLLRMYLPYTIPAGSLNLTNSVTEYRLPDNIHLTDKQVEAINNNKNGFYNDVKDSGEDADKYLGAEAIEGDRRPDQELRDDAQEYIGAIVRVKELSNGVQDLIFTFVPYTIEKNQIVYDADKNPVSTGENITGWFACDFNMEQIDWEEEETEKTAEIIFAAEDKEKDIEEISSTLRLAKEPVEEDDSSNSMTEEFKSGTLTADGDGYTVTMDYTADAQIPETAKLFVREITAETDRNSYEEYLAQAEQHVADNGEEKANVDKEATRFFDIEILVEDGDGNVSKIEPEAPVNVRIQMDDAPVVTDGAQQSDPTVLHFAEEGVETIDATAGESAEESKADTNKKSDAEAGNSADSGQSTEISFEAESFSVYGVVYTVDFLWDVNGKTYEFSIPGGGYASFEKLAELLGLATDEVKEESEEKTSDAQSEISLTMKDIQVSEETKHFVSDVKTIEFSNPEFMWVGKNESESTVGAIKEENKLEAQYSAELTEEQIAEINAQTVEAGDWALISLKPFESAETLTVTMKDDAQFVVRVTDAQTQINGATVHYGYMDGNTFHEFTTEEFTPPTGPFGDPAYLIYDVPGYQYAGNTTHVYKDWIGRTVTDTNASPLINGTGTGDYYVCYKPRPAATQGGTSIIQDDYPQAPTVLKKSAENPNTGTNTISLEVSGPQRTAKGKADIIVIYDVSGSMQFPIWFDSKYGEGHAYDFFVTKNHKDTNPNSDIRGSEGKYWPIPDHDNLNPKKGEYDQRNRVVQDALVDLASDFMGNQSANDSDPPIRMGLVTFSTMASKVLDLTGSASQFDDAVSNLTLDGGTNWEAAFQLANSMNVRSDADTYVIFITDGNPTNRVSRMGETDDQLTGSGDKSGINAERLYGPYGVFGTGNVDTATDLAKENTNTASLNAAKEIVDKNKVLFGIGISPEVTGLYKLIEDSGSSGTSSVATDSEAVNRAINTIKGRIREKTFGFSDVKITDGITALTQTVQKTGMTTLPDSDDFEYFKGHAATQEDVNAGKATTVGETVWEVWTETQMSAEGAGRASYNNTTGAVEWNLGETFMLEDGVKYKVDFTVWPSQEAYDLLADLNNGLKDYDNLDASVKAQVKKNGEGAGATYTLKTNRDEETGNPAGYTYRKATKEGEDGDVIPNGNPISGTFPEVIPLKLRVDKIGVQKEFSNLLDTRDPTQIQLQLWGNRLFKTFTLTADGEWKSDNNYISCGQLTVNKETGEVYVYETGHDFTLKETGEDSIYWELTADTYHPMVINDELHMLCKVATPAGMDSGEKYYIENGKEYYRIDNQVYLDEGSNAVLNAVNDHRSFLDLSKVVTDKNGNPVSCNDLFEFNLNP